MSLIRRICTISKSVSITGAPPVGSFGKPFQKSFATPLLNLSLHPVRLIKKALKHWIGYLFPVDRLGGTTAHKSSLTVQIRSVSPATIAEALSGFGQICGYCPHSRAHNPRKPHSSRKSWEALNRRLERLYPVSSCRTFYINLNQVNHREFGAAHFIIRTSETGVESVDLHQLDRKLPGQNLHLSSRAFLGGQDALDP